MSYAAQELRLRQQTTLAPRLQQSVKLLQMSALEFTTAVQHALATNPFLEDTSDDMPADPLVAGMPVAVGAASGAPDSMNDTAPSAPEAGDGAEGGASETAGASEADYAPEYASEFPGEYSGDYPTSHGSGAQGNDLAHWVAHSPSLCDRLLRELGTYTLNERDRALAAFIIDALDSDGYLRTPLCELAGDAGFEPEPDEGEWLAALKLVQSMDIPGLGARDLRECLLLQLQGRTEPGQALAQTIVEHHLERLGRNDMNGLQKLIGCDAEALQTACALIRGLDPKPGRRYDNQAPAYVVPDVFVSKYQSRWRVVPNRHAMPRARLYQTYADLFRRARVDNRSPMAQELQEARWLVRNVEQRYTTIQRVAEAIVKRQQRFFEYGEVALRPLMLREVADDLDMHESTVSRATANKYMVTPRGVFEFRHFFSRELATESGGSCSSAAVRALIRELIDAEDPAEPLSDVTLTERLAANGIVVARRTVTKYRGQMRLAPAELRRH